MVKGIFYSEFDNVAGPQIVCQEPQDLLGNDVFDSVSGYIIIDKALCGRIISVCVQQMRIVGFPVFIEDNKYHRNALLFNIGFVFDEKEDPTQFLPILRKLGIQLEGMERENGFLSSNKTRNTIQNLLPRLLSDLTTTGECTLPIDPANILNLKLFPRLRIPSDVEEYQVPIALRDLHLLLDTNSEWDLALQQIVPYIDGVRFVKRISMEADVELSIVKQCIQQLIYFRYVALADLFMYSNLYATSSAISHLATDTTFQDECTAYVSKTYSNDARQSRVPFAQVFALYNSIHPSYRLSEFCSMYHDSLVLVDVRRFITFGIVYGLLRRVHRYPIYNGSTASGASSKMSNHVQGSMANKPSWSPVTPSMNPALPITVSPLSPTMMGSVGSTHHGSTRARKEKNEMSESQVLALMDGTRHTDEICCIAMLSYNELERMGQRHNCTVVHK